MNELYQMLFTSAQADKSKALLSPQEILHLILISVF